MIVSKRIVSYLPEAADLYADAYGLNPRLIPLTEVLVLFGEIDGHNAAWLRVEVDRNTLDQRGMGPERLLREAKAFQDRFALVDESSNEATCTYESIGAPTYHRRVDVLPVLARLFDHSLLAVQRHRSGRPTFLVQSSAAVALA